MAAVRDAQILASAGPGPELDGLAGTQPEFVSRTDTTDPHRRDRQVAAVLVLTGEIVRPHLKEN